MSFSISSTLPQLLLFVLYFFFNDTATTEIYTLSLHDALPISTSPRSWPTTSPLAIAGWAKSRSEEHTSELQSRGQLVCRLLLEKKKNTKNPILLKVGRLLAPIPRSLMSAA